MDRQSKRDRPAETGTLTDRQVDKQAGRRTDGQAGRQADGRTEEQADGLAGRWAGSLHACR